MKRLDGVPIRVVIELVQQDDGRTSDPQNASNLLSLLIPAALQIFQQLSFAIAVQAAVVCRDANTISWPVVRPSRLTFRRKRNDDDAQHKTSETS